jgi:hypothetical protein
VVKAGQDPDALLALTLAEESAAKARAAALVDTALRFAQPGSLFDGSAANRAQVIAEAQRGILLAAPEEVIESQLRA